MVNLFLQNDLRRDHEAFKGNKFSQAQITPIADNGDVGRRVGIVFGRVAEVDPICL